MEGGSERRVCTNDERSGWDGLRTKQRKEKIFDNFVNTATNQNMLKLISSIINISTNKAIKYKDL
jgi:hypothetical protein